MCAAARHEAVALLLAAMAIASAGFRRGRPGGVDRGQSATIEGERRFARPRLDGMHALERGQAGVP